MNRKRSISYEILSRFVALLSIFLVIFSSVSYPVLAASIWTTDSEGNAKTDFEPGDEVYVQGTGFDAESNVDITVTRPDSEEDSCTDLACAPEFISGYQTTDTEGDFTYVYDLDGIEGEYDVYASDGTNDAETTFTDARTINGATVDGGSSTTVSPGASVTVELEVTVSGMGYNNWKSTKYKIEGGSEICEDTPDHTGKGTWTESFTITAPGSPGVYDLDLMIYKGDSCSSYSSDWYTLTDGITVTSPAVCGDSSIDSPETCDDGDTEDGDGCSSTCQVESGWECTGEPSSCSEVCGDGVVTPSEECDDDNTDNGDGCDDSCMIEDGWDCSGTPSVCTADNPELSSSCGIDMVLIMDSSGSIESSDLDTMKDAFKDFVDAFLPNTPTQIAVVDFDDTATLRQDYTSDVDDINTAIDAASSGGATNWEDGLEEAHDQFDNRVDKPDLYVIASDGNPNRYGDTPTTASESVAVAEAVEDANEIKLDGVRIITLGIGDSIDADNLKAISSNDAYYSSGFDTLADDLAEIAQELCGGTITVRKLVDGQPEEEWHFDLTGATSTSNPSDGDTDADGYVVFDVDIDDTTETVDITEDSEIGYSFVSASCIDQDQNSVGTPGTEEVTDITIEKNDAIYCEFNNTAWQCTDEYDCGTCEKCDSGSCVPQSSSEDLKGECTAGDCASGNCDGAGACDIEPASTVCRASADDCDLAENCDGTNIDCPADGYKQDGTSCDDGLFCTDPDTCTSGVCGGPARDCSDTNPCTLDICDEVNDKCDNSCDSGEDGHSTGEPCGTGDCTGTYECDSSNPSTCQSCGSENDPCIIQCPNACNLNPDGFLDTYDFAPSIQGYCQADGTCNSQECDYGHYCADDDLADGYPEIPTLGYIVSCNAECDEPGDADCPSYCDNNVHYEGDCDYNNTCDCSYTQTDCSAQEGTFCIGTARYTRTCTCDADLGCQCEDTFLDDCNDGQWCNGQETCQEDVGGDAVCVAGTAPDCSDAVGCTVDTCNEGTDSCDHTPDDNLCPSDTICADNYCDAELDCKVTYFTTECRGSAGVCDTAEYCTGSSPDCPADAKSTAECRAATDVCDLAENCDGVNNDCPPDAKAPLSTPCDDGQFCSETDHCDGSGNCIQHTARNCDDGQFCTVNDRCDESQDKCLYDARDCSANDIAEVATCDSSPDDAFASTFDWRNAFTSVCDEDADVCTTGDNTINHDCADADDTDGIYYYNAVTHTCSAECDGAGVECQPYIAGDTCYYDGSCNTDPTSCACEGHSQEYCPVPGTVFEGDCYYGTRNCVDSGSTGGCTLSIASMGCKDTCDPVLGPIDTIGPTTSGVTVVPNPNGGIFNTTAITNDTCSNIQTAEYFLRHSGSVNCGTPGTGTTIAPEDDGLFDLDKLTEYLKAVGIEYFEDGSNRICIQAQDTANNWGNCACANFETDSMPPELVYNVRLNDTYEPKEFLVCDADPILHVTICDTQSEIQGGEYFLDMWIPPMDIPNPWTGLWLTPMNQYMNQGWHCSDLSALVNITDLEDGTHYINQIRGKDIYENWGKIYGQNFNYSFIIDRLAPNTTKVLDPFAGQQVACSITEANGETITDGCSYVRNGTTITLTAVDPDPQQTGEFSGNVVINYIVYWRNSESDPWVIDQQGQTAPDEPVTITLSKDSYHLIEYWATDLCGWEEEHHFELDIVDTQAPNIVKEIGDPKVEGDHAPIDWYIKSNTPITINCTDPDPHPVDDVTLYWEVYYDANDADCTGPLDQLVDSGSSDGFKEFIDLPDSCHKIVYWCEDALGNSDGEHVEIDAVDNVAPDLTKSVGDPKVPTSETYAQPCGAPSYDVGDQAYYITQNTEINLTCVDPSPHPVDDVKLMYKYYNDGSLVQDWTEYTGTITYNEDTYHQLYYYCEDALGNKGDVHYELDIVDTVAPNTTKDITGPKIAGTGNIDWYITKDSTIILDCVDPQPHPVDVVTLKWKLYYSENCDNPTWTEIGSGATCGHKEFTNLEDSCHKLEYYCYDALGNTEATHVEIDAVDNKAPDLTKSVGDPKVECNGGYGGGTDTLFEDDFETDLSKWYVSYTPDVDRRDSATPGDYYVAIEDDAYIIASIDTTGYENIELSYDRRTSSAGCGDKLRVHWRVGDSGSWTHLESICTSTWTTKTWSLSPGADDQSEIQIKFWMDDGEGDWGLVDDVLVTGDSMGDGDCDYYITQNTEINLTCIDPQPHPVGVDKIQYRYRVDGGEWTSWSEVSGGFATFKFPEDSVHELEYKCNDTLGNEYEAQTEIDIVDTQEPVTTKEILGPQYTDPASGKFYIDGVTEIKLTCVDPDPHPVDDVTIYYRYFVDDVLTQDWTVYTGQFSFPEESKHELEYYCIDALLNEELPHQSEIDYVDHTPPVTTKTYGTPFYTDGVSEWITSQTPITLTATDGTSIHASGVKQTYWRNTLVDEAFCLDDMLCQTAEVCGEWNLYEGPFFKPEESCHLIEYYSVDNVDKTETIKKQCVFVENTPPDLTKSVGEPKVECDGYGGDGTTDTLFEDDFETDLSKWYVNPSYDVGRVNFYPSPAGGYYVWIEDDAYIRASIDTTGYQDIKLSYWRATAFWLEDNEDLKVYWRIGDSGGWTLLEATTDIMWGWKEWSLPGAGDKSEIQIKFFLDDDEYDYGIVDEVLVTGDSMGDGDCDYYITQNTEINLTCIDPQPHPAGVDKIQYRYRVKENLEDEYGEWTSWSEVDGGFATFKFPEDSVHELEYKCNDTLGNEYESQTEIDIVDTQEPVTTKEILGPQYTDPASGKFYIDGVTEIKLTCVDPEPHPVDDVTIWYRYFVDDVLTQDWTVYTGQFSFPEESKHDLEYYCIDALDNAEQVKTETDYVDHTKPVTTKTYGTPYYPDYVSEWITSQTSITFTVTDGTSIHASGVRDIYVRDVYLENPDDWHYCYTDCNDWDEDVRFGLPTAPEPYNPSSPKAIYLGEESCHIIEFYSDDNVNKTEDMQWQCVFVDNTVPVSNKEVGEPKVECSPEDFDYYGQPADGCAYITQATEITLTCADPSPHPVDDVKIYYRDYIPEGECDGTPSLSCCELGDQFGEYKCLETNGCDWVVDEYCYGTPEADACENYNDVQCLSISGCDLVTQVVDEYCTGTPTLNCYQIGKQFGQDKCIETSDCEWVVYGDQNQFADCNGDVAEGACDPYNEDQCDAMPGCNWVEVYDDVCEGTPDSCTAITDDFKCEYETPGCNWIVDEYCDGTPETDACEDYDYFQCTRIPGCDWQTTGVPGFTEVNDDHITFTKPEDSEHILEWYCADALGNTETTHYEIDIVDTQEPITTKEVGEPKVAGDGFDYWVTSSTPFELTCIDPEPHPVDNTTLWYKYKYDGENWQGPFGYSGPFALPEEGFYYLEYWCIDALGNMEDHQFETDDVDNQCPAVTDIYPPDMTYVIDYTVSFTVTDQGGIGPDSEGGPVGVEQSAITVTGADGFDPMTDCSTSDNGITYNCEFEDQDTSDGVHTLVIGAADELNNYCETSSKFTRQADVTITSQDEYLAIHCAGCPPEGSCCGMNMATNINVDVCVEDGFIIPDGHEVTFDTTLGRFMPPIPGVEVVELGPQVGSCRSASIVFDSGFTSGTATITATADSDSDSVNVELFTCALSDLEISADPASIAADGTSTSLITIQLKDDLGNDLQQEGTPIQMTTSAGTLDSTLIYTDANGQATATLTSSDATAVATVTATVGIITDFVEVEFTPLPFNDQIELVEDQWKLISVPKWLDPSNFSDVFEADDYLLYYDEGWKMISSMNPEEVLPLWGFWAISQDNDETVTLTYDSGTIAPPQRDLIEGWNLIGGGHRDSKPVYDALYSIDGKYAYVLKYDNGWKLYSASGLPQDFTTIDPAVGYWVFMTQDAVYGGTL